METLTGYTIKTNQSPTGCPDQKWQQEHPLGCRLEKMNIVKEIIVLDYNTNQYQIFTADEDSKVIELLESKTEEELEDISILIRPYSNQNPNYMLYLLNNGTFVDDDIDEAREPYCIRAIGYEGCSRIEAWQYNIPLYTAVYSITEEVSGLIVDRDLSEFGILYAIRQADGKEIETYDSGLELIDSNY